MNIKVIKYSFYILVLFNMFYLKRKRRKRIVLKRKKIVKKNFVYVKVIIKYNLFKDF